MKLKIEKWVEEQKYSEEANTLFAESAVCYKIGAYRASIIMSYLAMQFVIRNRVLQTQTAPEKIQEGSWWKRQKNIKNDAEWDKEVFDLVNMGIDNNPFLITDDIRKQYDYWRTIRNICAHAKSDIISSAHVESLWLFIETNLNRFVVNGGRNHILDVVEKHFDPNYTIPGKSTISIIDSITDYVHTSEIKEFFVDLFELFHSKESSEGEVLKSSSEHTKMWREINSVTRPILKRAFDDFIKSDEEYLRYFIIEFPELINTVADSGQGIRHIWKERFNKWNIPWYVEAWRFFAYLLSNGHIEEEEEHDFIEIVIYLNGMFPPDEYIEIFKPIGFFEVVDAKIFSDDKFGFDSFNYCNSKFDDFIKIIKINGLNNNNVYMINRELNLMSYGTFITHMKNFFEENTKLKDEFIEIAKNTDLIITDKIII